MNVAALALASLFAFRQVDPYFHEPFLPDTPVENTPAVLEIDSALGEIESASFLVRPSSDLKAQDVKPSNLNGPNGAAIPASAIDVKTVKVWWAGVSNWDSDRHGREEPVRLLPNAILHDDGLVRVDMEKRVNYLRIDYPSGTRYVDILTTGRAQPLKYYLEQFRDAPTFVPLDLPRDTTRQFWITVKTPRGIPPGLYTGELAFSCGEKIAVKLNVYPFELPLPRTHHDIAKKYQCGIMGLPTLRDILSRRKDLADSERILLNIYRSAAEHNLQFGTGPGDFADSTTDDLGVRGLFLRYRAGLQMERFTFGRALDHGWYGSSEGKSVAEDEAALAKAIVAWKPYAELQFATLRKYLGDDFHLVMNGRSEASTWGVRREQPFFREVERMGGGTICDTGRDTSKQIAWGMTVANVSADSSYSQARRWHLADAEIVGYYAPCTSPWDPDVFRRRGIRNWFADYDGIHEMGWLHGKNPWNDHLWSGYMYRSESLALPDADGVVCTLSYEGYREMADDIAYFSLHRLLSEKALALDDPDTRKLGRAEWEWLERTEPDRVVDLVAFRREVAKRIIALQEKAGPLPSERWTRDIPALESLPPQSCTETNPDILAKGDRLDLAIPAAERALREATASGNPFDRAKAAVRLARFHSELLRRDRAVALLDGEIAAAEKDQTFSQALPDLLLGKIDALLTDAFFEEHYTEEQLEEAIACLARLRRASGKTHSMVFSAFDRVIKACNDAQAPRLAAKTLDEAAVWVEGVGADPHRDGWRLAIDLMRAETYRGLEEWAKAIKIADRLAGTPNVPMAEIGKLLADCGEKAKDWTAAARGCGIVLKTLSKEQAKEKAYWQRRLDKATEGLRANPAASMDAPADSTISLDEE